MIQETIVTTQSGAGLAHIAPMGVHLQEDGFVILPFRPSTTLDNLLANPVAVLNYCDDVRVFAGCLSGRRDWPLLAAEKVAAPVLACALAHTEVEVVRVEDDATRPKLFCKAVHSVNHAPFTGFNRAQFAVLEAAILVSRLHLLPVAKIDAELAYLKIGFDKTAGEREREAWAWLMDRVAAFNEGVRA
ncbi:MAG: DUF447 family protein [Methylovulum sp.]|uniref:DUF447 domain-containing protein n=1 Tax=Methylovulum sp. TaxID=1916980 RepID=UPI00262EF0DD|nr:DUF447 domain-containing protein [Methylovulum sp.]MDD2724026.1 DUF447 family protein [Methylovulum sp.]MDD5126019.1 DUF447 family protein [Methylovulum sp.]